MARFAQSRFFGFLLLTVSMIGWGFSFAMNRWLLKATPLAAEPWGALSLTVLRFAMAAPVLAVWSVPIVRRHGRLSWRQWGELSLLALLSVVGYHLLASSAQAVSSSTLNAVLHQVIPVIAFAGGLIFLRERLSVLKFVGLVVATTGAVWYSMAESAVAQPGDNVPLAALLVVLVGIDWTIYMVLAKKALQRWSGVELTVLTQALAAVMLIVLGEALRPVGGGVDWTLPARLPAAELALLVYLALVAGIVCYSLYNAGLRLVEASRAAVFDYLLVPVTMTVGACLPGELHEQPTAAKILSAAVIVAGVYLVTWQRKKRAAAEGGQGP